MRAAALLILLLGLPATAFAIQPKPTGEAPPATTGGAARPEGSPGAAGAAVAVEEPEKVRVRREAQQRFERVREKRRTAFLAAAKEFSALPARDVAGWRESAVKGSSLTTPEDEDNPLNLGRTLLIFSGVTAFLVFLLRFPPNRWPIWPGGEDDGTPGRRRKGKSRQDGPMTVRLKPREKRWSGTASRG